MNMFNRCKHQLYGFSSFAEAAISTTIVGTFVGLHFLNTHPTNNWTMNPRASSSISIASYAQPPFISLNSFINFAARFWSKFLPTKCEVGFVPTLINFVILWMTFMFTSILYSSHKYASCTHETKTFTTAFNSKLRMKCGMRSRLISPEGARFSIHSYGANTSTFLTGSIFLQIY